GIVSAVKSSGCSSDSSQKLGASGVSAGTGVSYGGLVVKIPARYNGPDTSGNGGWVSGLVAGQLNSGGPATVMLKLPPPLDVELEWDARSEEHTSELQSRF